MNMGGFDIGGLMPLLIIAMILIFVYAAFEPLIIGFVNWLLHRSKSFIERVDDAHVALFKKRKKMAKHNIRDLALRRVIALGDDDYYDTDLGKACGIIWKNEMAEVFIQQRKLRPWGWALVPKEEIRDCLGRNLRIKCNGLEPIGNYLKPIPTRETLNTKVKVNVGNPGVIEIPLSWYYDELILDYEAYLMTLEKAVEAEEQKVHAMIDAVDVKRHADTMIQRPDYAPKTPGEPEEGKQYDEQHE